MTPERLKRDAHRLKTDVLPSSGAHELIEGIHSDGHKVTGWKFYRYDFRLCISSSAGSVCFSSDAKVGFIGGETFELSTSEEG